MPADASYGNIAEGVKLELSMWYEIWQMYGSWTGRSSERSSDVSKKEGQESAALYHGLRKGRSSERR